MYSAYFRLTEPPFSLTPDPRYLFVSVRHREGLAHLLYGIQQPGGFVQLTGEVGCGKTTLCRSLVKQLPSDTDVALILNPRLTVLELLASVCDELGIQYPPGTKSIKVLVDALNQHLLAAHAQGRKTVLIIDEAQNLQSDVLEQIRLLTNLETSKEKLLQIILIGQPELLSILTQKKLRQLAQRITARYHLQALSRHETEAYVRHRLRIAGRTEPLFTPSAMRRVYRLSGGVPRLINIICDRALLGAYALDRRLVSASIVSRASWETQGVTLWPPRLRRLSTVVAASVIILLVAGTIFLVTSDLSSFRRNVAGGASAGATANPPANQTELVARQVPGRDGGSGSPTESLDPDQALPPRSSTASSNSNFKQTHGDENRVTRTSSQFPRLLDILSDPALHGTTASCFESLYARLGVKVSSSVAAAGCPGAGGQGFECFSRTGNWTKLRQFDLPAILEVSLPSGLRQRVTLVELSDDSATLAIGGRYYTFPLAEIDKVWSGSFTLVWRLPFNSSVVGPGMRGEQVAWVRRTLDTLDGKTAAAVEPELYDEDLRQRVMDFQRDRLLPRDGIVGNATLVRLTLALEGRNAPSVSRRAP